MLLWMVSMHALFGSRHGSFGEQHAPPNASLFKYQHVNAHAPCCLASAPSARQHAQHEPARPTHGISHTSVSAAGWSGLSCEAM